MTRLLPRFALLAAACLLLAACATGPASPGSPSAPAGGAGDTTLNPMIAAPGEVVGQGLVIQTGDTPPQFCLGAIGMSDPPQCGGPELVGWDWDAVEGEGSTAGVTSGSYALWGDWNGERLTVTSSIMLALYDPMPFVDPVLDPANAGDTDAAELTRIQDELTADPVFPVLMAWQENGYLFVQTYYDDGTIQAWVDNRYLPDTVAIRPSLRDVS